MVAIKTSEFTILSQNSTQLKSVIPAKLNIGKILSWYWRDLAVNQQTLPSASLLQAF